MIHCLLERGAKLKPKSEFAIQALRITAREGHQELFQFLVKRGVDINKKFNHMSPIHIACQAGREDMVRCMVVRGANPNATNKEGQTALILAAELGHVAVVQTLLDLKVSVNIRDGRWQVKVSTRHGSRERPPGDHGVA
jgi:ankyrin repeat protein